MSMDDKAYELDILKQVISTYLNDTVPFTEEGLNSLTSKRDEIVYKIATKIYHESGHKLEFSFACDTINSHIEVLKTRIAKEKAIAYKRLQSQKAEEALQSVQENQKRAQAEKQKQNRLIELARKLNESKRDTSMSDLFFKVQNIISEQLSVDLDVIKLNAHISNDLGADELDTFELAMALEEEFDIEIPDNILGSVKRYPPSFSNSFGDSDPVACTVGELLDFIHNSIK